MKTTVISIKADAPDSALLREPADLVRRGEVVGFPTETVYGLAARADRPEALERLRQLKGRSAEHRFTLHLADAQALDREPLTVSPVAWRLVRRCWPGPLTLVLPGEAGGTVGCRVPAHEVACAFLRLVGAPVVGTSANPTGEPPAVDGEGVLRYFAGRIPALIDSGRARFAQASTVVTVEGGRWEILRVGALSEEKVRRAASVVILIVCTGNSCRSPMATHILKQLIADDRHIGVDDVEKAGYIITSAGTASGFGGATEEAMQVVREFGGDISGHVATALERETVEHADHILAMTESHRERITELDPTADRRTIVLDIPDPIGGDVTVYRRCAHQIRAQLKPHLARLCA
jgi:protein-tyrosine phosphatase